MAHVAFLWHMHQPYYVDPSTQSAVMPWVRLHCAKSYLDMISLVADYPGVRANFNLTPVLVLQIRELLEGRIRDEWLELSRKPAAELEDEERFRVLENFFKANWDNLVHPHSRYRELLSKRGTTLYRDDVRRGVRYFSAQELLDLQVWFNLTWCGFTACRLFPELAELKRKGRGFTEQEKHRVLDVHLEIMRLVLRLHREAEERGQVELTTTPFFHPILPLLIDSQSATRAMPGREMPRRFAWPQDAEAQLTLAVEQHAAVFGRAPRGLWPGEGAVSPEMVPMLARSGIEYVCSDEEILFATLKRDPAWRSVNVDHLELFQGWRVRCGDSEVNAIFRERPLSDFIGFTAAKNEPAQAAMHLLFHLRHIADLVNERGVIPLMLDGENAWEHFRDGGEAFLRALYSGIESDARLRSTTLEDYLRSQPPKKQITTLHSGSWIGASYDIWIGEEEENRAWELLGETRAWLEKRLPSLTPAQAAAARKAMLAAEGSDWFWWYGPDFTTENDPLFDRLFRAQLRTVFAACGAVPPAALEMPIAERGAEPLAQPPTRFITPEINGSQASFFEWSGAGVYKTRRALATMARGGDAVTRILFGNDDRYLYLHVELDTAGAPAVAVRFQKPDGVELRCGPLAEPLSEPVRIRRGGGEERRAGLLAFDEILELAIPLEALGASPGEVVSFQLAVVRDGIEDEQHPATTAIEFPLLNEEWALENWSV
ncbi:MAG: glycoside hydrolase family 57 protein [Chthoniobacteraceae bacterium]